MDNRSRICDWSDLQFFLAVAAAGSFQAAARVIGTNQSTVSRRILRMEERLETKLFDRHAHGMLLTEPGKSLTERLQGVADTIADVERHLVGFETRLSGRVAVSVTDGIGSTWLLSILPDFYEAFPEIDLDIHTNLPELNHLAHETDIAIQVERPTNPRLVSYCATTLKYMLCASREYLDRKGMPDTAECLSEHEFLNYAPYNSPPYAIWWIHEILQNGRVRLSCNSGAIYLAATRRGIGIGLFPQFWLHAAPDLIELPIRVPCESKIWVVTHEETNKAYRIRAVSRFIRERLESDKRKWFPA